MQKKIQTIFIVITAFLLMSCAGFQPVYGSKKNDGDRDAKEFLNSIVIKAPSGRDGQIFYTALYDSLSTRKNSTPTHILTVSNLSVSSYGMGVQSDATTSINQLSVSANFDLVEKKNRENILSFSINLKSTYNIASANAFSAAAALKENKAKLLKEMATRARLRLALFLSGNHKN